MNAVQTDLTALLSTPIEAAGYELWGYDWIGGNQSRCLRVYIAHPDGITVDDCAKASRQISAVFAVDAPSLGEYELEVSSPGLDRPLYRPDHYQYAMQQSVKIQLRAPNAAGQRRFRGVVIAVDKEVVTLQTQQGNQAIAFAEIEKARVVTRWE